MPKLNPINMPVNDALRVMLNMPPMNKPMISCGTTRKTYKVKNGKVLHGGKRESVLELQKRFHNLPRPITQEQFDKYIIKAGSGMVL